MKTKRKNRKSYRRYSKKNTKRNSRSLNNYQSVGGKKKADNRSRKGKPATKIDIIAKILKLLILANFSNTNIGKEVNFSEKTPQQKYNFIRNVFNTVITKESISSRSSRTVLVIKMRDYHPTPSIADFLQPLTHTGHTLLMVQLDDGSYGTIGFYPKNYESRSFLSLFTGSQGILASPDPIARNLIENNDNSLRDIELVYNGYLSTQQSIKLQAHLESISSSRRGINHYEDIDMGIHHPLALGNTNNCLTWLNTHLGLPVEGFMNSPINAAASMQYIPTEGAIAQVPGYIPIDYAKLP